MRAEHRAPRADRDAHDRADHRAAGLIDDLADDDAAALHLEIDAARDAPTETIVASVSSGALAAVTSSGDGSRSYGAAPA